MAYRYEELTTGPNGLGLAKNAWHHLVLTPTSLGQVLDIAGLVTYSSTPDPGIQVAGYAALTWTDNGRFGSLPLVGKTTAIATPTLEGRDHLHLFTSDEVDVYRDSSGFLPSGVGVLYYFEGYIPATSWRFFVAVP